MERTKKNNLALTKAQKKSRLDFSNKYRFLDWSRVVFMGLNKINGFEIWGVISQFDGCSFRAVVGTMKTLQYVSFLDNVVLPLWKRDRNLIFVHVRKRKLI